MWRRGLAWRLPPSPVLPHPSRRNRTTLSAFYKILVVSDEPPLRRALFRTLRREGYEVLLAGRAREALEVLNGGDVDLVVADHGTPGLSGADLLRAVGERWPWVVRVLLAGTDLPEEMDAADRAEVHEFLGRAWDESGMRAMVRLALQQSWLPEGERTWGPPGGGDREEEARGGRRLEARYRGATTLHWDEDGNLLLGL